MSAGVGLLELRDLTLTVPVTGPLVGRTKSPQRKVLIDALNWQVHMGQRWCVIGRNGAGKSTLLRALAGLPVPGMQGEVCWQGRVSTQWSAWDAAAVRAYVPQQVHDRFGMSVQALLDLARLPGRSPDLAATVQALDVAHLLQQDVRSLSGGERQRVALAQCAAQGSPLMLLDEPVSFQDPAHRLAVGCWMASQSHACVVFSAHDPNWIGSTATHVLALFGDGQWQTGPIQTMLNAPMLAQVYGCSFVADAGGWAARDEA